MKENTLDRGLTILATLLTLVTLTVVLVYIFRFQPRSCVVEPVGANTKEAAIALRYPPGVAG
ncbi:hypothetical protein H6G89_14630 [Oscillatoria sp. FACHB-1407]|uniref:hypothetical protein n=1 Tax=Oscillatoria sp. FACHB-1407 TaxID=2692847 RepID=UPI001689D7A7|nr:hypothetical protein [Oscillatoria sp. FACHB-1407]MBD2462281.1 hypothetical protein [Oscillatoria sp. FACHB-1407]